MNPLETIKQMMSNKKLTDRDLYIELIGRVDNALPGDADKLFIVMETLGITVETANADAMILREFFKLKDAGQDIAQLQKDNDAADKAWQKNNAEYTKQHNEWHRIGRAKGAALDAYNNAVGKLARVEALVTAHPHLFPHR